MCRINCSGGCPECAPEEHGLTFEPIVLRAFPSERKDEEIIVELWNRPRFDSPSYKRRVTTQEKLDMFQLVLAAAMELL